MTPLTVACVWVRGNVPYTAEYVTNLRAMVRRHLRHPHRFVCFTDQPWLLQDIATIPIASVKPLPGWWAKLQLFNPERGLTGRVLYLDLDTLIVGALDPIVEFDAPLALVPHAGTFQGRKGLAVVKRFNSSVMVFDAETTTDLWTTWTPAVAARLWGDQDHIGERRPDAATMPAAWFPRLSEIGATLPAEAKVILAKKPKPAEAAERWPWVREIWRAA